MHQSRVEHELARGHLARQPAWAESIAVEPDDFACRFQQENTASKAIKSPSTENFAEISQGVSSFGLGPIPAAP